jgi:serine/threonine protein kinase
LDEKQENCTQPLEPCDNAGPRRYDMGNMLTPEFNMEEVKLLVTDFGFSRRFESPDEKSRTFCGSAAYAAPEIIKGEPYKMRDHDMWSLGVILFIMVCGTMPYDDSNVRKMLKEQLSRKLRFPPQAAQTLSDECKDLIHKLIEPNANRRYKIDQILSHPWLTQIPNEEIISTPSPIVIQSLGLEENNNNSSSNNKSAKKSQSYQKSQHNPTASDQSHQQHQHQQGKEQQAKNGNTNNKFWW